MLNIVLVEPEIPQNTGNIARTCAATGAALHLVRPLGFEISDKYLKRAGLDYWSLVTIKYYDSFAEVVEHNRDGSFFLATTKTKRLYSEVQYGDNAFVVFGKETKGLPLSILNQFPEGQIRVPMKNGARSLNLSNSVAIVAYEALKQQGFPGLE